MSVELREAVPDFVHPDFTRQAPTQPERSACNVANRITTSALHYQAVERVILAMRQRLNEPMSLRELAKFAMLSPYHFNRVFRLVTGVTPCRFLNLLRMEAAKHLLIATQSTISDICFGVGFHSLGSFTRDFRSVVGLTPSGFRRLAQDNPIACLGPLLHLIDADSCCGAVASNGLTGQIYAPDEFVGFVFVGLFPTPIPQGRPAACTLLPAPGAYRIGHVPDGQYYLFAGAIPKSEDPLAYLLPDQTRVYVGTGHDRLQFVDGDIVNDDTSVKLRPLRLTDPPILVALPVLMAEYPSINEMVMT
jgi:AraC family transcriptional regulator